jgi:hypothetical protein
MMALLSRKVGLESRVAKLNDELQAKATKVLESAAPDALRSQITPIQTRIFALQKG